MAWGLEELLRAAVDLEASDLHLSAGTYAPRSRPAGSSACRP
jgi:Tfp pilus assembly pilus retraction ATPase PilT